MHRLRVIHLHEADYNQLLKFLCSRKLTEESIPVRNLLHDAQGGSRPSKKTIDLVVCKEHKFIYLRLSWTELLTIDNYAKFCFDRFICNFAILISKYFGIPDNMCNMQAKTLQTMEFR